MKREARTIDASEAEVIPAGSRYVDLTFFVSGAGVRGLTDAGSTREVLQITTEVGTFVGVVVLVRTGMPTLIRVLLLG